MDRIIGRLLSMTLASVSKAILGLVLGAFLPFGIDCQSVLAIDETVPTVAEIGRAHV